LLHESAVEGTSVRAADASATYFPHVEGLRGVAALYVFLYHIWQTGISHAGATLAVLLPVTLPWLQFGHFAVAVFIVISGYCLGLPVAQRPHARFDALRFARRRARRLGPAYVLALFLSVVPFFVTAALRGQHIPLWHVGVAIAAHLALVHNWIPALAEYLNGPMWSIALECQIYVVFALLLVPLWKRFGTTAQLAAAAVLGLAPHFIFRGRFDYTIWWLLALFAMGVAAAHATAQGRGAARLWRPLALACALLAVVAILPSGDAAPDDSLWKADLLVGVAVALLFVSSGVGQPTWTARFLSLRPIVTLGTFSYSLYLVHGPLVVLAGAALARYHVGVAGSALAYAVLVPAVIAASYGFYRVAERPFLSPAFRAALERSHADAPAGLEAA
jgi:peptidoglycan/LPS O-acetylase OafA/YrhL